jgi:hypothetical protein
MKESDEQPDLSSIQVKLNEKAQTVSQFRFKSGEGEDAGKIWIHIELKDVHSGLCQDLEVEFTGLVKVWNQLVEMQEQFMGFNQELQSLGQEYIERFQRAMSAFRADPKKDSDS